MKRNVKNQYSKYSLCMNPFGGDKDRFVFAKSMSDAAGLFCSKLAEKDSKYKMYKHEILEVEPDRFIILQYAVPQRLTSHPLCFEVRLEEEDEDIEYVDQEQWEEDQSYYDVADWDLLDDD
jgi:hypothetical protein